MVQKVKSNTENAFLDFAQIENLFWTYPKQFELVQNKLISFFLFDLFWLCCRFHIQCERDNFISVPSIYRVIFAFLTFTSGLIRWRYGCDAMISKAVFWRVFTEYACTVRS